MAPVVAVTSPVTPVIVPVVTVMPVCAVTSPPTVAMELPAPVTSIASAEVTLPPTVAMVPPPATLMSPVFAVTSPVMPVMLEFSPDTSMELATTSPSIPSRPLIVEPDCRARAPFTSTAAAVNVVVCSKVREPSASTSSLMARVELLKIRAAVVLLSSLPSAVQFWEAPTPLTSVPRTMSSSASSVVEAAISVAVPASPVMVILPPLPSVVTRILLSSVMAVALMPPLFSKREPVTLTVPKDTAPSFVLVRSEPLQSAVLFKPVIFPAVIVELVTEEPFCMLNAPTSPD